MSKLYIVIPVDRWLDGSTRDELGNKRAIWIDFIALARRHFKPGECEGVIPLPRQAIARICKVSVRDLEMVIEKCIQYDKIKINDQGHIQLLNWDYYNPSRQQIWDALHPDEVHARKTRYEKDNRRQSATSDDKRRHPTPSSSSSIININNKKERRSSKKKDTTTTTATFTEYIEELRDEYHDIDFDEELKKFWLYQSGKPAKNAKLALRKWMNQARQFQAEKIDKGDKQNDRDKFIKGRYGHVVKREKSKTKNLIGRLKSCDMAGIYANNCESILRIL